MWSTFPADNSANTCTHTTTRFFDSPYLVGSIVLCALFQHWSHERRVLGGVVDLLTQIVLTWPQKDNDCEHSVASHFCPATFINDCRRVRCHAHCQRAITFDTASVSTKFAYDRDKFCESENNFSSACQECGSVVSNLVTCTPWFLNRAMVKANCSHHQTYVCCWAPFSSECYMTCCSCVPFLLNTICLEASHCGSVSCYWRGQSRAQ